MKELILPNKLIGVPEWAKPNPKAPQFKALLPSELPSAPEEVNWADNVTNFPIYSNDKIGDCVIAWVGHAIQIFTTNANKSSLTMTDEQIIEVYSAITGYIPGDSSTDNGTDPDAAWQYWKNTGMPTPDGIHKIIGYANIDKSNIEHIKLAIDWFGCVGTTWALPKFFQGNPNNWYLPPDLNGDNAPYSWGGHQTGIGRYKGNEFTTVTWGEDTTVVDPALFNSPYCVGITAYITEDWFDRTTNKTPCMMDMGELSLAMEKLK